MSAPTKPAVIAGIVVLSVLGFITVLGEPIAAWLSPPELAVPSSGATPASPGGHDAGAAVGRDG